jgi:sugar phosphate isomerase/epimerase
MPNLAAFPKAYMDDLCVSGTMTIQEWIDMAATLDIDGLEMYAGMLDLRDASAWPVVRRMADEYGLAIPMLCCSPDFTHPDPHFRQREIDREKGWIDMAAALGARYCRVLSGQRRPEVSLADGLQYAADCIHSCLAHAKDCNVILTLENHYKDNYWEYPEFAQRMEVFCALIERVVDPWFGVNYDPSNTILAGEDPLELLRRVRSRVVTMHASDRYLAEGTLDDLRKEQAQVGYSNRLSHGTIGEGLNDYDAIFSQLRDVGFDGWVSIEDGVDGFDQLRHSVTFLRTKMHDYFGDVCKATRSSC